MKVILVMVTSVDGKSTKGRLAPNKWASTEDQRHFFTLLKMSPLVIMGRKTYEAARSSMELSPHTMRVVVTSYPERFLNDRVPGILEFTKDDVKQIVSSYRERGYTQMLVLGGERLNKAFFENSLIEEIWLTIEPRLFGMGKGIVGNIDLDIRLQLLDIQTLNACGTLLLKYKVVK